jgi:hypothetical protein
MPNIKVLSLDHTSADTWSDIVRDSLSALVKSADGSILLPHLEELSLLGRGRLASDSHNPEVFRILRNLATERRGTLTQLVMPPLNDVETLQILKTNIERVKVSTSVPSFNVSPFLINDPLTPPCSQTLGSGHVDRGHTLTLPSNCALWTPTLPCPRHNTLAQTISYNCAFVKRT